MRFRPVIVTILAILVVSAAAFATWSHVLSREQEVCAACRRPVHSHSRTVAIAHGKKAQYCCPACALSEQVQRHARLEVTALTDYDTGASIPPDGAWLVRGSDSNMCARMAGSLRPDKHPMEAHYDRCSPGMVAFSSQASATAFVRNHGGQVVRFATLAAAR